MLTEFDQSTIANMTAALEHVCKKIPSDRDSHELRKQIADEIIACARGGRRTLIDFQDAGSRIVEELMRPAQSLVAPLAEAVEAFGGDCSRRMPHDYAAIAKSQMFKVLSAGTRVSRCVSRVWIVWIIAGRKPLRE